VDVKRTYGNLALNADRTKWQFTKLEPHVAIKLKQIFASIPKTESTLFQVKNTQIICADIDWFTSRYGMVMTEADRAALTAGRSAFDECQAELGRIFAPNYQPSTTAGWRPGKATRNYQSLFADLAHARKSVLNGDDVGLGKTVQHIALCLKPGTLPAAVVVKTHLQQQWAEKYLEFTSLRVHKIKTRKAYSLPPADVYLYRYTQLSGWVDFFATGFFKSVGYDEVQELRTGSASEKGQAAYVLTENTEYHAGYSATPIYGYGAEIFNIMRAVDPAVLGDIEEFYREWCDGDKVKNPDALGTYLREQNVFLRRTKKDVGMEMPPVNTIIENVESDSKESDKVYELARKLALRTISGSFMERGSAARELDLMVRQATGVGKAKPVAAYVRILLENNIPVLLCGWHRACFAAGTMALMFDGTSKPVEQIVAGDVLMGPDSGPRTVKSAFSGNGRLLSVVPNKGRPFVCSEHHILQLRSSERSPQPFKAISARDYTMLSARMKRRYGLYRAEAVDFEVREPVFEPWLVGYWLGNGAARLVDFRVSSDEKEVRDELLQIASRYGLTLKEWQSKGGETTCMHYGLSSGVGGPWGRNEVLNRFKEFWRGKAKHIPMPYKIASIAERWELLAGLIDSDGHMYQGNSVGTAEYCSVMENLANDVAYVARSLGLAAYVKRAKRTAGYSSENAMYFRVSISGDMTPMPNRVPRKRSGIRAGQKSVLHTGFKVEDAGVGDYFGFEVDRDHLFLLDDFTVVHNCYDIWLEELAEFNPVMYTGSESTAQKAESKRKFQSGESNLMIISHLSGDGLDGMQHRCSTIVFGELSWSSGRHYQLIGRLDRDGQRESVTAIYLVSDDGSDPPMMDIIGLKASQSSGIVDPGVAVKNSYSDNSRLKLLAQQYLTKNEIAAATKEAPADAVEVGLPAEDTTGEPVSDWPTDEAPRMVEDTTAVVTTGAEAAAAKFLPQPELF
jgi:hypothetical protein